jgi:polysaccharide pyruvyl transferase WcaK-like protein
MKKIALYMHGGALNRGCEAIVRSIVEILGENEYTLYSRNIEEDHKVGLDSLCDIEQEGHIFIPYTLSHAILKVKQRLLKNPNYLYEYRYENILNNISKYDYWISIGGDNYCGYGFEGILEYLNKQIKKKGKDTILFGCSIEPDDILILKNDLNRYSLIVARESITYNALLKNKIKAKVILLPDPAFALGMQEAVLPENFIEGEMVGINVSPLIQKKGKNKKIVLDNYIELIEYIIEKTEYNIVLLPHVIRSTSDDLIPLEELYSIYEKTKRVSLVNKKKELNCMQLKFIISKCRFIVTARTHASIAGYSACIPTLVIGYSVKAKGIAQDLFGEWKKYVIDVQEIECRDQIKQHFIWLEENEENIKKRLKNNMAGYLKSLRNCSKEIEGWMKINNGE